MDSNYYNDNTLNFGNNPNPTYQVIAQWLSPADNQIYVFKSDDLNYDPTSYVSGKEITVYIDPTNPQKYYVDVSTLPKVAN